MMNRDRILDFLKQHRFEMHERFSVKRIGLLVLMSGTKPRPEVTLISWWSLIGPPLTITWI